LYWLTYCPSELELVPVRASVSELGRALEPGVKQAQEWAPVLKSALVRVQASVSEPE
jgi:hypothetical protein